MEKGKKIKLYSTTCFLPPRGAERKIAGINANLYTIYSSGRLTFSLHVCDSDKENVFRIFPRFEKNMNKLGYELSAWAEHISLITAADVHRRVFSRNETKVDNKHVFQKGKKCFFANGWNIDKHGKIMQMYCGDSSEFRRKYRGIQLSWKVQKHSVQASDIPQKAQK